MKSQSKLTDFLNGQLSDEDELKVMDQVFRYECSQLLKQELNLHQASALTDDDRNEPEMAETAAVIVNLQPAKPKKWFLAPIAWKAAAGIFFAVILLKFTIGGSEKSPEYVTVAYLTIEERLQKPMPPRTKTKSVKSEMDMRSNANIYYDGFNYKEAALAFQQLVDEGKNNQEDWYYGALSFLSSKNPTPNYGKAVRYLEQVKAQRKGWRADEVDFYLAIAYLKNGQLKESKDLFEELSKHLGMYQVEVQQILKTFPN
jgi:tetratricopeptide (TPR) repeat protein